MTIVASASLVRQPVNRHTKGFEVPYSRIVADYFAHPANAGTLSDRRDSDIYGAAGDREHGTEVVFHMRTANGQIAAMSFQAFGCPHTIAACSLATEQLVGEPVEALVKLSAASLAAAIEAPIEKMGRMLIVEDALRNCFVAWDNRPS
jgi:nitrogen fixation NifU-like protein